MRLATNPVIGTLYAAYCAVGSKDVPGIYKSINHGENWQPINNGIETSPDDAMLKMIKASSEKLASARTVDSLVGFSDMAWCFDLQISPSNPKVLFAAMDRALYRTEDAGNHWHKCETFSGPRSVAFHPQDPRTIALAAGLQTVWLSRDGGQTWNDISAGLRMGAQKMMFRTFAFGLIIGGNANPDADSFRFRERWRRRFGHEFLSV